jgi:hypothetical protein
MKTLSCMCLLLVSGAISTFAQSIPTIRAKALDGTEVMLPEPGSSKALVLVTGFSHKSADEIEVWGKHLSADLQASTSVAWYEIPNLAGVPGLVKPMILHGMKKEVPESDHSRFVPIYDNKTAWEKLVSFSAPDDPYLIVAAPDGRVIWTGHGPYSDQAYAELKSSLARLAENTPTNASKP